VVLLEVAVLQHGHQQCATSPEGNTLIDAGAPGRMFEVTREGTGANSSKSIDTPRVIDETEDALDDRRLGTSRLQAGGQHFKRQLPV